MRSPRDCAALLLTLAAAVALALPGCERTMVEQTLETNYAADDVAADLEFTHGLPVKSAIANDEGLHALIVFALGQDTTGGYEQRVALAKQEGWLAEDFDEPPNMAMQRGTLARALVQVLGIRGGLVMRLIGPNPRNATRELVDAEIFPPGGTANQTLTGLEFLGALGNARDFLTRREFAALKKLEAQQPPPDPADADAPAQAPAANPG
ncbi:MAG: hypothetical protein ACKVS8_06225 [Phycisphaerales bacterium]